MSQRNQTKRLIQDNLEDVIPFFQSVKGYGLFWDNYSPTIFKDNQEETSFLSEVGDCIDYYFMYGENADGVVAQMRYLTGQVPMFPLWTYGFWQSRERYKSQKEIVGVVQNTANWVCPSMELSRIGDTGEATTCGTQWIFERRILRPPK